MHYYSHNIGDYRRRTSHLSVLEHGVYRQALDQYYLDESPLTSDISKLERLLCVRNADEKQALCTILDEFFELTDAGYRHRHADGEILKYKEKSAKASAAATARWNKENNKNQVVKRDSERNADAMQTHSECNANHKPITNNHKPITKGTRLSIDSLPTEWAEFCRANRPDLNPKSVFDGFRDYWIAAPGQKGVKLDWLATWRNWVRSQKPGNGGAPAKRIPQPENFDEKDYGSGGLL